MKLKIAALILAGGNSTRMGGRDKALIPWQGITMLDRVLGVANRCCDRVYVFTPRVAKYRNLVREDCTFMLEQNAGRGPLIALASALRQINPQQHNDWILLLACDLPKLKLQVIQSWIEYLQQLPEEIEALVPQNNQRWQPLCAFYRPRILPALEKFIELGGNSFQVWLSSRSVRALFISQAETAMLWNCNTFLDLQQETVDNK